MHNAAGLRSDCERLHYPLQVYRIGRSFSDSIQASMRHVDVMIRAVTEYGTILFLDAECRILRRLPPSWTAPLVAVRQPSQPFWARYNSGTMMVDRTCLPWLEAWRNTIADWSLDSLGPEDYIHWPGDICDETALAAVLSVMDVRPLAVALEYVDRSRSAPIARGYWRTADTIIQHPTIHHWPSVDDVRESKKLFLQNYPTDTAAMEKRFETGGELIQEHGWIFDLANRCYALEQFWADYPRI